MRHKLDEGGACSDAAISNAALEDDAPAEEQDRQFLEDGRHTYDQFAKRAADILNGSSKALTCYAHAHPVILLDEFQDTNAAQWSLVKALRRQSAVTALVTLINVFMPGAQELKRTFTFLPYRGHLPRSISPIDYSL